MNKKYAALTALALASLLGTAAFAEDALTLDRARQLALSRSNAVQQALLTVDSSLLDEKAQGYSALPQLSLSVSGGISYPASTGASLADGSSVAVSLSATQTIYDGGKNAIELAIDRLATKSARESARAAYLSAAESASSAYYAVLEAQAGVAAAQKDLEASRAHQDIAQAKFDAGVVIKAAVAEAQAETASKETALSQARKTLAVAKANLASLTGVTTSPEAVDVSAYDATMATLTGWDDAAVDSFISRLRVAAIAGNPDLAVSSLAVQAAQSAVDAAKTGYLPTVSAALSHKASYSPADGFDLAADGGLTVSVSIPLDAYVTKNSVQTKTIAAKKAALEKEAAANSLDLEIQSQAYALVAAASSVSSSKKALEYAESNYEVELELYKLSRASSSDLSDAELLVSTNRSAYISAQYTFITGLSALTNLGGLDSEALLLGMMK